MCKRLKLELFLAPYTRINSKWIKDLNVRSETIKLLEENTSGILYDIKYTNIFGDLSQKTKEIKAKIKKLDVIKLKSVYTPKETINKMKKK